MSKHLGRLSPQDLETELNKLRHRLFLSEAIEKMSYTGHYEWNFVEDRLESCSEEYARIFDMSIEEVIASQDSWSKTLEQLHPDDREEYAKANDILLNRNTIDVEFRIIRKDGEVRHIHEQGILILDEAGNTKGNYGILQDITQQKNAEQELLKTRDSLEMLVKERTQQLADSINQLQQEIKDRKLTAKELKVKNAELERFTYTVSHDLKSPLITIKGFIGLLGEDIASNNQQRITQDIDRINEAADTMQNLLNELLSLSRIGHKMGKPVVCNLTHIAQHATQLVEDKTGISDVEFVVEDMPKVKGDQTRILEVYLNLLDNATKFMADQKSPRVVIGSIEKKGRTRYFVRDNGIGIDVKFHHLIFDLFERLDPKITGTGIGLALVKRIIETHGGNIWVESEGLGCGTTMWFTFGEYPDG